MHNGHPSTTSTTASTATYTFFVIDDVADVADFSARRFNESIQRLHSFAETTNYAFYAERRRKRFEAELEKLKELVARPGRPVRAHFPEACRAPLPEARQHVVRRVVVSKEWNEAMRARWLR